MDPKKTSAEMEYADILHLPHRESPNHPRMSLHDRAAQFSPFAALTGYEAAVEETARLTEARLEMSEDKKQMLDEKLRLLLETSDRPVSVCITYFVPDAHKAGGAYVTVTGRIREIDAFGKSLILTDQRTIPLADLWEIEW